MALRRRELLRGGTVLDTRDTFRPRRKSRGDWQFSRRVGLPEMTVEATDCTKGLKQLKKALWNLQYLVLAD